MVRRVTSIRSSRPPWQVLALGAAILVLFIGGFIWLSASFRNSPSRPVKLPARGDQQIAPFGEDVLYYDGTWLRCVNGNGNERWNFQIGQEAGFHAGGSNVAVWAGDQLYILDKSGNTVYKERMGGMVQFARVGLQYVAACVGDFNASSVTMLTLDGSLADPEPLNFDRIAVQDIGFFGKSPEMMWVLCLDTTGTVLSCEIQVCEPGKSTFGSVTLGEQLIYRVYYHDGLLRVVDTRQIRSYPYDNLTAESTDNPSVLIYGWYLHALRQVGRDMAQLLVPTPQIDGRLTATDLRLLVGKTNRVLHLPATCLGAVLGSRGLYAFTQTTVYMCAYGSNVFTETTLPVQIVRVLGSTDNDRVLVTDMNNEVYLINLP